VARWGSPTCPGGSPCWGSRHPPASSSWPPARRARVLGQNNTLPAGNRRRQWAHLGTQLLNSGRFPATNLCLRVKPRIPQPARLGGPVRVNSLSHRVAHHDRALTSVRSQFKRRTTGWALTIASIRDRIML
jgi:hypothetical protein